MNPITISQDPTFVCSNSALMEVFQQIPQWSQQNFGDQKGINHLAPMLGLIEEMGEFQEARELDKPVDEIKDAVADICIYMIDFLTRLGIPPETVWPTNLEVQLPCSAITYLGQIAHAVLKQHQGIRGYENKEFALAEIERTSCFFLYRLNISYDITSLTIDTWIKVVSKRNWVAKCQKEE